MTSRCQRRFVLCEGRGGREVEGGGGGGERISGKLVGRRRVGVGGGVSSSFLPRLRVIVPPAASAQCTESTSLCPAGTT